MFNTIENIENKIKDSGILTVVATVMRNQWSEQEKTEQVQACLKNLDSREKSLTEQEPTYNEAIATIEKLKKEHETIHLAKSVSFCENDVLVTVKDVTDVAFFARTPHKISIDLALSEAKPGNMDVTKYNGTGLFVYRTVLPEKEQYHAYVLTHKSEHYVHFGQSSNFGSNYRFYCYKNLGKALRAAQEFVVSGTKPSSNAFRRMLPNNPKLVSFPPYDQFQNESAAEWKEIQKIYETSTGNTSQLLQDEGVGFEEFALAYKHVEEVNKLKKLKETPPMLTHQNSETSEKDANTMNDSNNAEKAA